VRERREIHDEVIVAENGSGKRGPCRPYPTPWFNEDGEFEGAVNVVIELTCDQAQLLSEQAARCKRLAWATSDRDAARVLAAMSDGYAMAALALKAQD
jgi:hypothetical protein